MANHDGDFIWYELITPDPDAAQAFYGPLVGWTVRDSGMPDMDYRLASASEGDVAGIMKQSADMPMPPSWLGYIAVADVDQAAQAIAGSDGTIHMAPFDIPGVGRMALVADPQGALFYIMRGESGEESHAFSYDRPRQGHCAWNELSTSDPAAAHAFYGRQFGWEKDGGMEMGPLGTYDFLRHSGRGGPGSPSAMLGALMPLMPGQQRPGWQFYFRIPDIDAAAADVEARGGRLIQPPIEIPGGEYSLTGADPHGALFGLVGPRKA
jgi:predicted enzyme related to lactoylglutathione lyase